ncbi:hypothetical protein [Flavobacterium sp.]|uniref:hypothetical protein n=1 Tax=Flavobacterium sp. TaxID=239 RepID=UPI003F69B291
MKKLELNQMENLEGGTAWGCAASVIAVVAATGAAASLGPAGITLWSCLGIGSLWVNSVETCAN